MGTAPYQEQFTAAYKNRATLLHGILQRAPWFFIAIVLVPTFLTAIYMFLIAAPVFESETHFVVRSRSQQGQSALGMVLSSVGVDFGSGSTDAYEVDAYMMSRDAVANLTKHSNLRAILDRPESDFLSRFPVFYERNSFENLFKSYPAFVSVGYDSSTGINTLRVKAFRATDANMIASALLASSEKLVNELNQRAMGDVLAQSLEHVSEAQAREVRSEVALTEFRTREKLIDPTRASAAGSDIVSQIDAQVIALQAQRASLAALAPESPELPALDQKIQAYQAQRNQESTRVAGESNSLAPKIGEYERLMLDRDYATKSLANADASLEQAQSDAHKKEIYLEMIAAPDIPDQAEFPHRFEDVLIVFVSALVAYATLMLTIAGLREHKQI